jgi:hypothetical protein
MDPARLSPPLAWFVRRHFRSIEDLEITLLLFRTQDRWWSAPEISATLPTTPAIARDSLDRLSVRLVERRAGAEPTYRLAPDAEVQDQVGALQEIYLQDRSALLGFIAPGTAAIRDFADAFRLKKEEGE